MSEPSEKPAARAADASAARTGFRVYAVVRADEWSDAGCTAAVSAAPVRLVRAGAVAAVVGAEPARTASPPAAQLLLHETVVEALGAHAVAAPVAPDCVTGSDGELCAWLDESERELLELLGRLDGRCEVGVLAWWDRNAAAVAAGGEPGAWPVPGLATAGRDDAGDDARDDVRAGGVRDALREAVDAVRLQRARLRLQLDHDPDRPTWLLRRGLRSREAAVAAAYGARVASALHASVAALAEAGRRGGPPSVDVLLDASYLMRRARLSALDQRLGELAAAYRGAVMLRRTAPRVPWRFATLRPFAAAFERVAPARATPASTTS